MMIRLSREEMLHEWKRRKGLMPLSTSTLQVSRLDSDSVDDMLQAEIDDWYANLLASEPLEFLPHRDFSAEAITKENEDGSVEVELPLECVRVVSVKMNGWKRSARITEDVDGYLAQLQTSRYVSGKSQNPIAIKHGRRLTLYSKCGDGKLSELLGVAAPADGSYVFERGALFRL